MPGNPPWRVAFTMQAERDIVDILAYMADCEGPELAETMLEQFIKARDSLSLLPERGRISPELMRVNVLSYREIQIKPYRIVYQLDKTTRTVFIHLVVDGRRNLTELLQERLLRPL